MKVLPIQNSTKSAFMSVKNKLSRCKQHKIISKLNFEFKGNGTGALGGFCFGSLAGMAGAIGAAILGASIGLGAFLSSYLAGAFGGTYLGDRLEYKVNKFLDEKDK